MKRLDVLLVEKKLYASREKAKQAVESGRVLVDGVITTKASLMCGEDALLQAKPFEFVSRGGFKLQKALEEFKINLLGRTVLDVGASTGGFTDVCLKNGAKKVYAVDTGEGQLAAELQNDKRVTNLEKTNYISLPQNQFLDVDFVCIDVSFVSLTKLVPKLATDFGKCQSGVLSGKKQIDIVALIKPQFECGLEYAKKHKGIVKDEKMHKKIVEEVCASFQRFGFEICGTIISPIKGGDGNVEFLLWAKN